MKTETYTCHRCGIECIRPVARGQRPKWCSQQCADLAKKARHGTCELCGKNFNGHGRRFCSRECGNLARRKPKKATVPTDPRGKLRRGYEEGDAELFFAAIAAKVNEQSGCWVWPHLKDGYPMVRFGRQTFGLHRLVLEMKHGAPLGSQHAHHMCANSGCVNPEHLQPVTHRDNIAEMLARQSYLNRIAELESALAAFDPNHPLLFTIAVA